MGTHHRWAFAGIFTISLVGGLACATGDSLAPSPRLGGADGLTLRPHPGGATLLVPFALTVDATGLTASILPAARTGAGVQQSQYDIDPAQFYEADTLAISAVRRIGYDDIQVEFTHAHPWPAVDLSQPVGPNNRADLGYTGRLLILTDLEPAQVAAHSFFGGTVKANTEVVRGADGYLNPGDLLSAGTGFQANTFPYMLLADELKDNRVEVSNGSVNPGQVNGRQIPTPEGNYDPTIGGWQQANLGAGGNEWTGFDYLHAGQTIVNSFRLSGGALRGGTQTLPVALMLQYTEPKAAKDPALRLPPATADPAQFAYRLPAAALDNAVIRLPYCDPTAEIRDRLQVVGEAGGTGAIACTIRDWDTAAVEAGQPDLSLETQVDKVEPGHSGPPTVEADCPSLSPTPAILTWTNPSASGWPRYTGATVGDELQFAGTLTNTSAVPVGFEAPGLMRVTDPEATAPPSGSPKLGIDPVTLAGSAARALAPVTYQAFFIRTVPPVPGWQTYVIDPSPTVGEYASMVVIPNSPDPTDDRLAIAYLDRANLDLKIARSTKFAPQSSADWQIHSVDTGQQSGHGCRMVLDSTGKLAVCWYDIDAQLFRFAQANGAIPSDATDWAVSTIETGIGRKSVACGMLVDTTGQLMVAYIDGAPTTPGGIPEAKIARAQTLTPVGPADWLGYVLGESRYSGGPFPDPQNDMYNLPLAFSLVNGKPVLPYRGPESTSPSYLSNGRLAMARVPVPLSAVDWDQHFLNGEWDGGPMPAGDFNGVLASSDRLLLSPTSLGGIPTSFATSRTSTPRRAEDWYWYSAECRPELYLIWGSLFDLGGTATLVGGGVSLGGSPPSAPHVEVFRARTAVPQCIGDWQRSTVAPMIPDINSRRQGLSAVPYFDRLAITYTDENYNLSFAYPNVPW